MIPLFGERHQEPLLSLLVQWDHQRELQKSGKIFKFGSYKYSARNLADRGVLVSSSGTCALAPGIIMTPLLPSMVNTPTSLLEMVKLVRCESMSTFSCI
jgi:hypothetical protein